MSFTNPFNVPVPAPAVPVKESWELCLEQIAVDIQAAVLLGKRSVIYDIDSAPDCIKEILHVTRMWVDNNDGSPRNWHKISKYLEQVSPQYKMEYNDDCSVTMVISW